MAKLTPKQQRFVNEYLIDLNATQAYLRAGYNVSENVAAVNAQRLLRNANIQAELTNAMQERSERTQITQDMVLRELAKIGFSDLKAVVEWTEDGRIILRASDEVDGAILAEVSETEIDFGDYTKRTKKVKLHDKMRALELIGKHLGMFKDNVHLSGEVGVQIVDDIDGGKD